MSLFAWEKSLNLFSLDSGKHPKLEGQEEHIFQSAPGHDLWHRQTKRNQLDSRPLGVIEWKTALCLKIYDLLSILYIVPLQKTKNVTETRE